MNDIKTSGRENASELHTGTGELVCAECECVWCESAGDFTLPDYMPEIGKMLSCVPRIIPSGRYIGSDRAEFSGSVVYSVLYTGDDGMPFYTTLSGDYEYTVPLGAAVDSVRVEIYDEPSVESVSVRASGPRKITARARIKAQPYVLYEEKGDGGSGVDYSDQSYQRLTENVSVSYRRHFESGEFPISLDFRLEASPEAEPVGCDGVICVSELNFTAGTLICRGEVECRVLYYDIEGGRKRLLSTRKKMRFEKDIPVPTLGDVSGVRAYGRVISTDMSASEDSNDMSVTVTVNICGEYTKEEKREFLRDVYLCERPCTVNCEKTEYRRGVLCKNLNLSCHSQKKLPETAEGRYDICTSVAAARVNEVGIEDGNARIWGEISLECIMCEASEDNVEYSVFTLPIPFKCETSVSNMTERYEISVIPEVASVRARVEKDMVTAEAELYLSVLIGGVDSMNTVKSVLAEDTRISNPRGTVCVYYPENGETLWSVSKKYLVPVCDIADANGIQSSSPDSPESLEGIGSLLII